MKKFLLTAASVVSLLCFSDVALAQRALDIGFSGGITNYFGDLGNETGRIPYTSTNHGFAITVRNFLNNPQKSGVQYKPLSLEARFSVHRIGYDEAQPIGGMQGSELRNYYRGINFRNDIIGTSVHVTYTIYPNKYRSLYKQKFCFFGFAGIGVFYSNPKADLFRGSINIANRYYAWNDGTLRDAPEKSGHGNIVQRDGVYETTLRDWRTEGQGDNSETGDRPMYPLINIGFPVGFGVRYGMSRTITLSAEVAFYYFLTDYLDDVSSRYATTSEIDRNFPNDPVKQELATYISDPTGRGTDGTLLTPPTSRRGNPKYSDLYTYISLEVAYKFQLSQRDIYGRVASSR
jgi:hypothetical protein